MKANADRQEWGRWLSERSAYDDEFASRFSILNEDGARVIVPLLDTDPLCVVVRLVRPDVGGVLAVLMTTWVTPEDPHPFMLLTVPLVTEHHPDAS